MKSKFSPEWKASSQPRKQRKYIANAPLHVRQKLIGVHLSKELRNQFGKRSLPLRKGDEVKILRGSKYGLKAKVAEVNLDDLTVYLEGQLREKTAGKKVPVPFQASNLMITDAKLTDKKRAALVERAKASKSKEVK